MGMSNINGMENVIGNDVWGTKRRWYWRGGPDWHSCLLRYWYCLRWIWRPSARFLIPQRLWGGTSRLVCCMNGSSIILESSGYLKLSPSVFITVSGFFESCIPHFLAFIIWRVYTQILSFFKQQAMKPSLSFSSLVLNKSPTEEQDGVPKL